MVILPADTLSVFIVTPTKTLCVVEYPGLQEIKNREERLFNGLSINLHEKDSRIRMH